MDIEKILEREWEELEWIEKPIVKVVRGDEEFCLVTNGAITNIGLLIRAPKRYRGTIGQWVEIRHYDYLQRVGTAWKQDGRIRINMRC